MQLTERHREYWHKNLAITGILLFIWFLVTFVLMYFARDLSFNFFGWPFAFYMAAQGCADHLRHHHLVLRALHERARPGLRRARRGGLLMAGIPAATATAGAGNAAQRRGFFDKLKKAYSFYTGGFIVFVIVLAIAEQMGLPRVWIGYIFLMATVGLYAGIGIISRTSDATEYYVAGRRVPAFFNGMATGADWMSAASFIGMAGTLYLTGFGGLAFVMGWTGGYCLVALFLAPYLRKFGQFTIPDFLGARYGGNIPRAVGILAAILCSFTYVVAQIYGVGLITTRLTGVPFEYGIFLGLGGILVCSFLGGMRAVTWTQVAQYIILIIAYMIPVVWLSVKQTGVPIPQIIYGKQLEKVTALEEKFIKDPKEIEVRNIWKARADDASANLKGLPAHATRRASRSSPPTSTSSRPRMPARTGSRRPKRPSKPIPRTRRRRRRNGRRTPGSRPGRRRRCGTPRPSRARTTPRATCRGATSSRSSSA